MGLALWPILASAQAPAQAPPAQARTRATSSITAHTSAQPSSQLRAQGHAKAPATIKEQPSSPPRARPSSGIEAHQPRAQPLQPPRAPSQARAPARIEAHSHAQPSSQLHTQRSAHLSYATQAHITAPVRIMGTVWQPDQEHTQPAGNWQKLGAHSLLVQWSRAGDVAFVAGCGGQPAATPPDWKRIAAEPWAKEIIMGLAGDYSETAARRSLPELIQRSHCLARLRWPVRIHAWYFPAEIDPTWTQAPQLRPLLAQLPHPLWVSAYDNTNMSPAALCRVLKASLPANVGVFFQDGVGVHARTAAIAHDYLHGLRRCLGARHPVRLIAEAMRPVPEGGFRAATTQELSAQLAMYGGEKVWLFEGPRYLNPDLVRAIAAQLHKK